MDQLSLHTAIAPEGWSGADRQEGMWQPIIGMARPLGNSYLDPVSSRAEFRKPNTRLSLGWHIVQ
jgi:hypothetical protein